MNKERKIEEFIKRSIKENKGMIDNAKLMNLFNEMTTEEIQRFWVHYSSKKILTPAIAQIPHWWAKKEQEQSISHLISVHGFYPKEKDKNGQYIIDRTELINHVKFHIANIIKEQVQSNFKLEKKPFLKRIRSFLLLVFVAIIPTYMICDILATNHYFKPIVVGYIAMIHLLIIILIGIIQMIITHKKN